MMGPRGISAIAAVGLLVVTNMIPVARAIPLQMTINQRDLDCMYEQLDKDESVTISAFILSGPELKATLTFDGPIAAVDEINTASELQQASTSHRPNNREGESIGFSTALDFEHLRPEVDDDDDDHTDSGEVEIEGESDADKRKRQREQQRDQFMAAKEKRERIRALEKTKVREDGEPFIHTMVSPTKGWYRLCLLADQNQVVVELELRKESVLGLNEDMQVNTYEEKAMLDEDELLEQDTAEEEGIKDEDFQETRALLKDLRKMLNQIQTMQQQERRRLTVHAETSSHSHSRMVLSSVLDTVLFMAVTSFQVYTIRKWFSGAPSLG